MDFISVLFSSLYSMHLWLMRKLVLVVIVCQVCQHLLIKGQENRSLTENRSLPQPFCHIELHLHVIYGNVKP